MCLQVDSPSFPNIDLVKTRIIGCCSLYRAAPVIPSGVKSQEKVIQVWMRSIVLPRTNFLSVPMTAVCRSPQKREQTLWFPQQSMLNKLNLPGIGDWQTVEECDKGRRARFIAGQGNKHGCSPQSCLARAWATTLGGKVRPSVQPTKAPAMRAISTWAGNLQRKIVREEIILSDPVFFFFVFFFPFIFQASCSLNFNSQLVKIRNSPNLSAACKMHYANEGVYKQRYYVHAQFVAKSFLI